jgi:hypothetical protein
MAPVVIVVAEDDVEDKDKSGVVEEVLRKLGKVATSVDVRVCHFEEVVDTNCGTRSSRTRPFPNPVRILE